MRTLAIVVLLFLSRECSAQFSVEDQDVIYHHYSGVKGIRFRGSALVGWPAGQGAEPTSQDVDNWRSAYQSWKGGQDDQSRLSQTDPELLQAVEIVLYQLMDTGSVTTTDLTTAIIDVVNERRDLRGLGPLPGTTYP
jgi:hypothetical protein